MLRSALAVLAGIVVLTVASFAIEWALSPLLLKTFPEALPDSRALQRNPWVRTLTFSYGFLSIGVGAYVTASIVGKSPLKHAAILGIAQAGLTLAAMFSPEANHASPLQWALIALLSIPSALAGGWFYLKHAAPAL
jgi:hypothetical protein